MIPLLNQIRYAIEDMKKHWIRMIFILLQLIAAMSLLYVMIHTMIEDQLFERIMNQLIENNSIYMLDDRTEEFRFNQMYNEEGFIDRMIELEHYIDNDLQIPRYIADTSYDLQFESNMDLPERAIKRNDTEVKVVNSLKITSRFLSIFEISGDYNKEEIESVFQNYTGSSEEIPILLGCDYKEFYSTGDVIYDVKNRKYKIYGILDHNEYYIAPNRINDLINLDNYVIFPCCTTKNTSEVMAIYQFLSSYFITKDKGEMYQIIDKAKELELMSLDVHSFTSQCETIRKDYLEKILFYFSILSFVFIFAMIGFTGNTIQIMEDSAGEYSIHLLCGATEHHILFRVTIPIILMIFLADFVTFLIFGIGRELGIIILCSLFVGGCLLVYPYIKISHHSIIMLIRRNVE